MNPASAADAGRQARELLKRHYRGAAAETRRRRYAIAELIAFRIWLRWNTGIYRWQQKQVRWYLEHVLCDQAGATRYLHFLVVRDLVRIVGRTSWLSHLRGTWVRPSGKGANCRMGGPQR